MPSNTDWPTLAATFLGGGIVGWILSVAKGHFESRQELRAAAALVRDEVHANIVQLEISIQGNEDPVGLSTVTYDSLQMTLARGLPAEVRDAVRQA